MLHGTLDRLIPVAAARMVARAHPEWSLVVLPGVGHVPQLEVPQACATEIREWLGPAGRGVTAAAAAASAPGPPPARLPATGWHPPRHRLPKVPATRERRLYPGRPGGRRLE